MSSSKPQPNDPALGERAREVVDFLQRIHEDRGLLADLDPALRSRLLELIGRVCRPDRTQLRRMSTVFREQKKERRRQRLAADQRALASTGIRRQRHELVFPTPDPSAGDAEISTGVNEDGGQLLESRTCYICKDSFRQLHFHYDSLCPACAELNWSRRQRKVDLTGRVALVTGGRIKIGYQTVVRLLRLGCKVLVSTRFPRDAAQRYAREVDFSEWSSRLRIFGLDLRHTPSVESFCRTLTQEEPQLDFLINNACQTVRRPPAFYAHMLEAERTAGGTLPAPVQRLLAETSADEDGQRPVPGLGGAVHWADPVELSQVALLEEDWQQGPDLFPEGALDADLQQIDLRGRNSWRLDLDEVSSVELLEVHLVNAVAPCVLNGRLRPLMRGASDRHIVNVSAMEGQFYRAHKTTKHPHTNMAKASLNMMTRTSAADYLRDGIHMNSVDTGWITDEDPEQLALRKVQEHGFAPPLDSVDAAARILDPILDGLATGNHAWGQFFKDYRPTCW